MIMSLGHSTLGIMLFERQIFQVYHGPCVDIFLFPIPLPFLYLQCMGGGGNGPGLSLSLSPAPEGEDLVIGYA